MQYIAFDAHKHYTLASVEQADGRLVRELQIPNERGACGSFSSIVTSAPRWRWKPPGTGTGLWTKLKAPGACPASCTPARPSS